MSGKIIGTILFVGGVVVFDILSYVFEWGWMLY